MKVTCPYCHQQWQLTSETITLALEKAPPKSKSIGFECPRCRKWVKVARPKRPPTPPTALAEDEA